MLRKLMKYELRSVYQTMLPLYGAVLIIGAINAIFSGDRIPDDTVRNISGIVYIALLIAMATLCLVIAVQRFYNGLLSEEGYLMFTLPVKPWQHIASKVLSAALMIVTGVVVTIITLVLIFIGTGINLNDFAAEIGYVFGAALQQYSYHFILYAAEIVLMLFILLSKELLRAYAAMSVGHLFSKHRLVFSFLSYALLGAVVSWFWNLLSHLLHSAGAVDMLVNLMSPESYPHIPAVHIFFLAGILWQLVEGAAYWGITNTILAKRLNLE